jgi:hypothetical protein
MKFKVYSSVLLAALFLSAIALPSQAASIAGTKCSKVGNTKTSGGLKHFCIKKSGKLVWNKGTAVKVAPKPTKSTSVTPSKSASPTAVVSLTKLTLEEVSKNNSVTSCWSIIYGKDGTSSFERQHEGDGGAANQLSSYFLGKLGDSVKL